MVAMTLLAGGLLAGGEVTVDLAESGHVEAVKVGGRAAAGAVNLLVPKKGWQGYHGTLREGRITERTGEPAAGAGSLRGVMPAGGETLLAYTCTLQRQAEGLRIEYEVTPAQDLEAAAVVAQVMLHLEALKGREWTLIDGETVRTGTFPVEPAEPYTFLSESGFGMLAWPAGEGVLLAVKPDWATVVRVGVQDDRRFGMTSYEIQLYAATRPQLGRGQPVRLGFTLEVVDAARLTAALAEARARQAALRETLTGTAPAAIRGVTAATESVPAYGGFEATIDLQARYDNPFDPAQVALDGHVVTPAGQEETVPGFYAWDYERSRLGGAERLRPTGHGGWRLRYCPREPGRYRYWVTLRNEGKEVKSATAGFTCTASAHPGFVRIAKANPLYFETDRGEPYFAIGENVCWPGRAATYDYDRYWTRLAENGANYARIWVGPFDCFTLERAVRGPDDAAGLGRVDLAAAWRLDYVLGEAERQGIRVMFCIDSFNSLRIKQPYPAWEHCPYNAARGGPLSAPEQFFTDAKAKALFKNRLRYIVARWGHLPAVLSWEFWNEVNIIEKYVSPEVAAWHQEMARYLRSIDPQAHLITTSWAGVDGDPAVDGLPEMDYIQSHQYGARDPAAYMARICREKVARYGKAHYFGEFGTGTEGQGTGEDRTGIHLHDGLWSGLMSQAAGTGMLWWWDNYVDPNDLYRHFRPVAEFVRGLPLSTTRFQPLQQVEVAYAGTPPPARLEDLDLSPDTGSWSEAPYNRPNRFVVHADGMVENREALCKVLHGVRNHPTLHNPATFELDYARDGEFVVNVSGVSGYGGANLRIFVDERQVLAKEFPDEDKVTNTLTQFDGRYAVPVPAGRHTVRVANEGNDWVYVSYALPGYRRRTDPGLQVYGLANGSTTPGQVAAILWLKNERHTWYLHNRGVDAGTIPPVLVVLTGLPDGAYAVEWWDTATGKPGERVAVTAAGGKLALTAPAISADVAAKVWRGGE